MDNFTVIIHGGAGTIEKGAENNGEVHLSSLQRIISETFEFATSNANNEKIQAVDIVEYAVTLLEDDGLFNAGYGSVLTSARTHELEAGIMDGKLLKSGAASIVTKAKNPVKLARHIMDNTIHCYLAGPGADIYAEKHHLDIVDNSYFTTERRSRQLDHLLLQSTAVTMTSEDSPCISSSMLSSSAAQDNASNSRKMGTVGAACYYKGNTAAATSTGGMTNKMPGRVGDAPIMGAGTYASNETCAVSCTGHGEVFIQYTAASSVANRMRFGGKQLSEAVKEVVHADLPKDSGGIIAVNASGYCMEYNTLGMYRGMCSKKDGVSEGFVAIWEDVHNVSL